MKNIVKAGLAIGLALILGGCHTALAPAYSPDGKTVAYAKNHNLVLNRLGHEQTISKGGSNDVIDDLAWSPDGRYVAWSTNWQSVVLAGDVPPPTITRIRNLNRGTTASIKGVGAYLAWLNGDLVAVDVGSKTYGLVTLDPDSAQVRSEAEIDNNAGPMTPAAGGRALYVNTGDDVCLFDGLHFDALKGSSNLRSVPCGRTDSLFTATPEWLPQHSLSISRWVGDRFTPLATLQIPERLGRNLGVTAMVGQAVVSSDTKVVVALIVVLSGTKTQEEKLLAFARHHKYKFKGNSTAIENEANRLTHNMKFDEIVYEWSPGFRGELGESADAADFSGIALDPTETHVAYASDKGLRIFKVR